MPNSPFGKPYLSLPRDLPMLTIIGRTNMKNKIITPGEIIHVLHRFEKEVKRHFVGEVECVEDGVARARSMKL